MLSPCWHVRDKRDLVVFFSFVAFVPKLPCRRLFSPHVVAHDNRVSSWLVFLVLDGVGHVGGVDSVTDRHVRLWFAIRK